MIPWLVPATTKRSCGSIVRQNTFASAMADQPCGLPVAAIHIRRLLSTPDVMTRLPSAHHTAAKGTLSCPVILVMILPPDGSQIAANLSALVESSRLPSGSNASAVTEP